jgi:hypothetical protein
MMIGALAILAIAAWFYRTAERNKLPTLAWCAGGVIIYYAGFAFWMYLVMRPLLGDLFRNHSLWLGLGMDVSAVLVGVLCAAVFRSMVMVKRGTPPQERVF